MELNCSVKYLPQGDKKSLLPRPSESRYGFCMLAVEQQCS